MLNFACKLVLRAMMDKCIGHVVIGSDRDAFHAFRTQIVPVDEIEHDGHARMRERSAGMRLDRDPGKSEGPRIAELAVDHVGAVAAARGPEKSPVRLQTVERGGEPERRQLGSHDTAFGGASRMKRLGHGTEVFAQAGGLGRAQAQGPPRGFAIESEQPRGTCRGADRAAGRGAVEPVLVVARQDGFGNLAFDFDADLIRRHEIAAALPVPLGERQRRRQRRCRRMREQPVHAILGDGELSVVVVVGMDRDAVGERREARGQAHVTSDHGAAVVACNAQCGEVAAGDVTGLRGGARECQADAVEHRTLAEMGDVGRDILCARSNHEAGNVIGQG